MLAAVHMVQVKTFSLGSVSGVFPIWGRIEFIMRCFCRHCLMSQKSTNPNYQFSLALFGSCLKWVFIFLSNCFFNYKSFKIAHYIFFVSWTSLICTNVLFSTHTPHAALRPIVLLFCQHVIVNNTRAKNFCKQSSPFHSGRWLEGCQRGLVHFVQKTML